MESQHLKLVGMDGVIFNDQYFHAESCCGLGKVMVKLAPVRVLLSLVSAYFSVQLFDLNGKSADNNTPESQSDQHIPLHNMPNGLYIISVTTEKGMWKSKINVVH